MKENVMVSVIIVTFNAERFLEATLLSAISQDYPSYEIIIVDGQSADKTVDIIRSYENHIGQWVSEPDDGIYYAMNKGLKMATGTYVQFLNAGDTFVDDNVLATLFGDLASAPMLIYGDIKVRDLESNVTYNPASEFNLDNLLKRGTGVACHQAMFVRRVRAPSYDTRYKYKAELNWYFDICELDGFSYVHKPIPVVTFALGGFGHQNFLRNRVEWVKLVFSRYGLIKLVRSGLLPFLYKNSFYRYPRLARYHAAVLRPIKALKGIFLRIQRSFIKIMRTYWPRV